jgi:hypothetical protein
MRAQADRSEHALALLALVVALGRTHPRRRPDLPIPWSPFAERRGTAHWCGGGSAAARNSNCCLRRTIGSRAAASWSALVSTTPVPTKSWRRARAPRCAAGARCSPWRRRGPRPRPATAIPAPAGAGSDPGTGPDWEDLRLTIAQMPTELQTESTWVYWNAQALLAQGRAEEGRAALRVLAGRFSYYGRLAAEQLNLPLDAGASPRSSGCGPGRRAGTAARIPARAQAL